MTAIEIIDAKKKEAESVAALIHAAYKVGQIADKLGYEHPATLDHPLEPVLLAVSAIASNPSAPMAPMAPSIVPRHLESVFTAYAAAFPRAYAMQGALAAYDKAFAAASPKARNKAFTEMRNIVIEALHLSTLFKTTRVSGLAAAERLVGRERAIFSNMALSRNPKDKHAAIEMTDEGMSDFDYLVSAANDLDHAIEMAYEADQANVSDEDMAAIARAPLLDVHYLEVKSGRPMRDHEAFDAAVKQHGIERRAKLGLDLAYSGIRFLGMRGAVRFVDWCDLPPEESSELPGDPKA